MRQNDRPLQYSYQVPEGFFGQIRWLAETRLHFQLGDGQRWVHSLSKHSKKLEQDEVSKNCEIYHSA